MSLEIINIFGVDFSGPEEAVMSSSNGEIIIMKDDSGNFTSFSIVNSPIEKYVDFLLNFDVKILSISNNSAEAINFDFSSVKISSIERLYVNLQNSDLLIFPGNCAFAHLREISIRDGFPAGLPSSENFPCLRRVTVEVSSASDFLWLQGLDKIVDLIIYNYPREDLTPLKPLKNVRRLCLVEGRVKSLDGIEYFSCLEAVHIVACSKLQNALAILKSKSIVHIMFEKFRKILDWSFLSQKKNLKTIWLEAADSVEFIKDIPELTYFKCIRILDKNLSPVQELGFSNLPHRSSVFYNSIV